MLLVSAQLIFAARDRRRHAGRMPNLKLGYLICLFAVCGNGSMRNVIDPFPSFKETETTAARRNA
jgi:hypothetical protein